VAYSNTFNKKKFADFFFSKKTREIFFETQIELQYGMNPKMHILRCICRFQTSGSSESISNESLTIERITNHLASGGDCDELWRIRVDDHSLKIPIRLESAHCYDSVIQDAGCQGMILLFKIGETIRN
jgi:hypothetical protein